VATISVQDRSAAQQLPDEFLALEGDAPSRVVQLVSRHWGQYEEKPRAQLSEALLPILEKLLGQGTQVGEEHRDLCEGLVAAWIFRQ
jgi:hypothetical protein